MPPFSPRDILLALATPVNIAQLIPRLFAYVETKAQITSLRISLRQRNLPAEILNLLATKVRDLNCAEAGRIETLASLDKCMKNECTDFWTHKVGMSIVGLKRDFAKAAEWKDRRRDEGFLLARGRSVHSDRLGDYFNILRDSGEDPRTPLAKAIRVMKEDFGLQPYFLFSKTYASWPKNQAPIDERMEVKAFLVLPLVRTPFHERPASRIAWFTLEKILDPILLSGPTQAQFEQFHVAMSGLGLRPLDLDEDDEEHLSRYQEDAADDLVDAGTKSVEEMRWDGVEDDKEKSGIDDMKKSGIKETDEDKTLERTFESTWFDVLDEERVKADLEVRQGPIEKGRWPRLMMLGCGELRTFA